MSNLQEMNERMQQWLNEKPTYSDSGKDLRLGPGSLVLGQFVANGDEGDKFIKIYRSHMVQGVSKNGKPFPSSRYCPQQSGETNLDCPICTTESASTESTSAKERMSMWFWVTNILHAVMPAERQFPQVPYEGKYYFQEKLGDPQNPNDGDFRIWHTSAWKDSPWGDICRLEQMYKGLHNFTFQMMRVGKEKDTRYKLYPVPNSAGLPPEVYTRAQEECQAIGDILRAQLTSPVSVNPQAQNTSLPTASAPLVQPFAPPGEVVRTPTLVTPLSAPAQENTTAQSDIPAAIPPIVVPSSAVSEPPTAQLSVDEQRRPMKSLF